MKTHFNEVIFIFWASNLSIAIQVFLSLIASYSIWAAFCHCAAYECFNISLQWVDDDEKSLTCERDDQYFASFDNEDFRDFISFFFLIHISIINATWNFEIFIHSSYINCAYLELDFRFLLLSMMFAEFTSLDSIDRLDEDFDDLNWSFWSFVLSFSLTIFLTFSILSAIFNLSNMSIIFSEICSVEISSIWFIKFLDEDEWIFILDTSFVEWRRVSFSCYLINESINDLIDSNNVVEIIDW